MIHNMTRLTTREEYPHGAEGVSKDKLTGRYCRGTFEATACVEKLAEYENAEEDGFLLWLPCKIGELVYAIRESWNGYNVDKKKFSYAMIGRFGKTVFQTEEAAWEQVKIMKSQKKNKLHLFCVIRWYR